MIEIMPSDMCDIIEHIDDGIWVVLVFFLILSLFNIFLILFNIVLVCIMYNAFFFFLMFSISYEENLLFTL